MRIQYLIALIPLAATAQTKKVHFEMSAGDYSVEPAKFYDCEYRDILKFRADPESGKDSKPTLVLNKTTAAKAEESAFCEKVFTNLTKLDQQEMRDEIAAIILEMPCEPDAEVYIEFGSTYNPKAKEKHPTVTHNNVVNHISIDGCLKEMPSNCNFPSKLTSWDGIDLVIDHEKLMIAFKDCHEALIKKVEEEGLREKWEAEKKEKAVSEKEASETAPVELGE